MFLTGFERSTTLVPLQIQNGKKDSKALQVHLVQYLKCQENGISCPGHENVAEQPFIY